MKYSASKENYIKAVYHLQQTQPAVSTNALAAALQTKAASVTDMLKKLKSQKLLLYERYKGVKLTTEGRKLAIQTIRKHRLWEFFLVNKLGFGWEEVHEVAEELEHVSSKKLVDKLEEFLGFPQTDPHGDPIPDNQGRLRITPQIALCDLAFDTPATVSHVSDQTAEIMELLNHLHLQLGTWLRVKKKFSFDQSLEIELDDGTFHAVSVVLAAKLFVREQKEVPSAMDPVQPKSPA